MLNYNEASHINIGTGEDLSILELAELVRDIVGFTGEIRPNPTKPDGTPRKLLDVSKIHELGWKHRIGLQEGIERTYDQEQIHFATSVV